MKQHKRNRYMSTIAPAVRLALMAGAAVVAVDMTSTAGAANVNAPAQLGKVTVTGTRIKRTNIETAQPITRISRQQIQRSGYTSISRILGQLSSAGGHARPGTYRGSGSTDGGTSSINLRNLGANRTLVLVNGKRWTQGLGGATNLNTIPTSIIDHIEILQDGASAVYGSDAIAGVVNIITVKSFNGAQVHAYYGIHNDHSTGYWDGQVKQYDFTVGSGNDRGNVVFNATYREQNEIPRLARKATQTATAGEPSYIGGSSGTPKGRFALFGPAVSGRTFGQGTCGTYDPASPTSTLCNFTLQKAPAQPSTQNFRNVRPTDRYYNLRGDGLTYPLKDVTAYVQGHYDLFHNVTFTANASYVRESALTPYHRAHVKIGALSDKTANGQHIGIAASNPYNPFGVDLVANPTDPCLAAGSCIGLGNVNRALFDDNKKKRSDFNSDYFHIFTGFNGFVNLFNREVDWNAGFAQSRRQIVRLEKGRFNLAHLQRALGPVSQCTSPCVPLNIFGGSTLSGGGSATEAQLNYIRTEAHKIHQSNLRDWTANLSSDVYDLPAGPLGVAIGWERIDNYGYYHPDAVEVAGNFSDGNPSSQNGRVVRDAEYAEINIPLLAHVPGAKRLSVDIANRWTQFKVSGEVAGLSTKSFIHNSSGRLNIRWQVINDLLLRASWSQGFRSPNVPDLFGGQHRMSTAFTDPCAPPPNGGYTGGALPANCPNGSLDAQPEPKINATVGSNPNLEPEKSISRTVGFVYSPSQVLGLDLNADYFKIELNNAISSTGAQNIIDGCFDNSSFCNLVTVQGQQVTNIRNINTNVGGLLTEGIDLGLHYKFPSTPFGDFDARINGTFYKAFDKTIINRATRTGFATSHLAGITEHPKRRFNGYLDWDYGNWSAQYHIEYFGDVVDQCSVTLEGYCSLPNGTADYQGAPGKFTLGRTHLGATVYHDVHVDYTIPTINATFGLGVNNLFDKKPPITGAGTYDLTLYRFPSRFIYGDIRVRF